MKVTLPIIPKFTDQERKEASEKTIDIYQEEIKQDDLATKSSNLQLVFENTRDGDQYKLTKEKTIIGEQSSENPDVLLPYYEGNQTYIIQRSDRVFIQESISNKPSTSLKVQQGLLYVGALYKIGTHCLEVNDANELELKVSVYKENESRSYTLRAHTTVGRSPNCEIHINHSSVHKQQAQISNSFGI